MSEVGCFWWLLHSKLTCPICIPSEETSLSPSLPIVLSKGRLHYVNLWKKSTLPWCGSCMGLLYLVLAVFLLLGASVLVVGMAEFFSSLKTSGFQLSWQLGLYVPFGGLLKQLKWPHFAVSLPILVMEKVLDGTIWKRGKMPFETGGPLKSVLQWMCQNAVNFFISN